METPNPTISLGTLVPTLSDIENLDIMLVCNRLGREESEFSSSVRTPEISSYNALVNHDVNSHSNSREEELGVMSEIPRIQEKLTRAVKSIGRIKPKNHSVDDRPYL